MLRQYVEHRTAETDGSEVLQRNHREVAEKQLVPRIIRRNREAILVDPHHFYLYQRRRQGRRCSCFKIETSPDGACQVCFGTGVVGAYEKFGTTSEWFDTTYPRIRAVNVRQNFQDATRPVMFTLVDDAITGYVEFDWQIRSSLRRLDLFQVIARRTGTGTTVTAYIRTPFTEFQPLTSSAINDALLGQTATIRVVLARDLVSRPRPILSHVMIRYLLCPDTRVQLDVPRVTESVTLAEYGVFDSFTTMAGWFTDQVRNVSTEDFMRRLHDNTFWKAIESQPNRPLWQQTSTDVVLRLIQDYEQYKKFPV